MLTSGKKNFDERKSVQMQRAENDIPNINEVFASGPENLSWELQEQRNLRHERLISNSFEEYILQLKSLKLYSIWILFWNT